MGKWRPEGWESPYHPDGHYEEIYGDIGERDLDIYEEGADAMMEALKKDGTHFEKGEWTDDAIFETEQPGTVVFIPDEE